MSKLRAHLYTITSLLFGAGTLWFLIWAQDKEPPLWLAQVLCGIVVVTVLGAIYYAIYEWLMDAADDHDHEAMGPS